MKRLYLIFTLLLFQGSLLFSQVAINADGSSPNQSAGLDISFPNKGLLIPRMNFEQRNSIPSPAQGLIVYCTDCNPTGAGVLCIFEGTAWKTLEFSCATPNLPVAATHVATTNQIIWDWNEVPIAVGYKFNTVNDFTTATDLGTATTYTETGLSCNTPYTRYIWSYNQCGYSAPLIAVKNTSQIVLAGAPAAGTHTATRTAITWNWNTVSGATGYKWNTTNDFATATDMGALRTKTETGLTCGTSYTRYVWAYNLCGNTVSTSLTKSTSNLASTTPVAAVHAPSPYEIVWKWHQVSEAVGYKWNTTNNVATAQNLGTDTSYLEIDLPCFTAQTRYVWSYNQCGNSTPVTLNSSTTADSQPSPAPASNIPGAHQVQWNWHPLPADPSNYKWNSVNNYGTAIDLSTDTAYIQTGLTCNTNYTSYIWAYDACAVSSPVTLSALTGLDAPAVPGPAVHIPSASQIVWKWHHVAGTGIGYKWSTNNNYYSATDLGTDTSHIQTGLNCNTNYTCFVWSYDACGVSDASTLTQLTNLVPPNAPVAGTHESFPALIVWNWTAVSGATGYKWNTTNNYATALEMGASTSKTESGLTCNTGYTRYVWAYSSCGVSNATSLIQSTAMDPPQNPSAGTHVPGPFQIVWNWFPVSDATGYKWNTSNDYNTAQDMGVLTVKTETSLNCNTNYTRYIWAYSSCGHSAAVSLVQTTSLNPPSAPTQATHVPSPSQVIWNWNPVSGATGYKWNTTNNYSTAIDVALNTTKTETGLTCNTPYIRYVWAYSNCGSSTATSLSQTTSLDPPAAPTAGTHVATPVQIIWNWNTVSGATGYKWNTTNNYATAQDMGTNLTKTETGLNCNSAYTRYVWAYSNCGTSTVSTLTKTTTIETPVAPVAGTHSAANTQIVWNWNAVSGATGYKWSTTNNYATATDMGTSTSKTETSLACGTNYTRYVWSYNNCANSVSTSLVQATTTTAPSAPTAATHVATANQITWNWTAVSGATGYKWSTTNNYATATDVGNVITKIETGLECFTGYTRYIWAYNGCANSSATTLTQTTTQDPPVAPTAGTHTATPGSITWNWTVVTDAAGYKFNSVNTYSTATDLGNVTSHNETGLSCNTNYVRYAWAYNSCGVSTSVVLVQTTASDAPASPTAGTQVPSETQIVWNWNTVSGASGYKWSTTNSYSGATDVGTATTHTETGLTCGTSYTRYVWAYSTCGNSTSVSLSQSTTNCWACGGVITVNHVVDTVAPVAKTVNYNTVTNIPGETSKCWITQNLGSTNQATSVSDNSEPSAGWYWQFNREQGFKHDGTTRTPNSSWLVVIDEYANWSTANDPCALELGAGWRVPTAVEWTNVDAGGPWANWNGPWNSALKMHAAGKLDYSTGNLSERGSKGYYWSATQISLVTWAQSLSFSSSSCTINQYQKAYGFTVRCIKN
jgi:hypothetical protein